MKLATNNSDTLHETNLEIIPESEAESFLLGRLFNELETKGMRVARITYPRLDEKPTSIGIPLTPRGSVSTTLLPDDMVKHLKLVSTPELQREIARRQGRKPGNMTQLDHLAQLDYDLKEIMSRPEHGENLATFFGAISCVLLDMRDGKVDNTSDLENKAMASLTRMLSALANWLRGEYGHKPLNDKDVPTIKEVCEPISSEIAKQIEDELK